MKDYATQLRKQFIAATITRRGQQIQAAKDFLGSRWILHRDNAVHRKTGRANHLAW